jgi:hypothetical protein
MSEIEEDMLSVVASTWSEGDNAEKTDACETVDEMEDMEGDWEVIDEVGDSDGPSQDDPSFEASRLVEEEGLEQEIGEIGDQSVNEQSIDQQIENLDGLTVTVGPHSLIRTVKASRLTSDLRLKSRSKAPAGPGGDREEQADHTIFHVLVPTDSILPRI